MQQKKKTPHSGKKPPRTRKQKIIRYSIIAIILLYLLNLATGVVTYSAMTVWCMRQPVTATKFGASYHYFVPKQVGYGPNMFSEYYCTEQDARDAGFNPSPWSVK